MSDKKFVDVTAEHSRVDRVLDVRMAAALKDGGQGIRYTCRVHGREETITQIKIKLL